MVFYGVDKAQNCIQMPPGTFLQLLSPLGGGSVVVCPFALFVCGDFVFLFCNGVLSTLSSSAVI